LIQRVVISHSIPKTAKRDNDHGMVACEAWVEADFPLRSPRETVDGFGRNDGCLGIEKRQTAGTKADSFATLRNDNKKAGKMQRQLQEEHAKAKPKAKAKAKAKATATATAEANTGVLRCAQNDNF
jgi:hypothetical protein